MGAEEGLRGSVVIASRLACSTNDNEIFVVVWWWW